MQTKQSIIETPIGKLLLSVMDQTITRLEFLSETTPSLHCKQNHSNTTHPLLTEAHNQLNHWFIDPTYSFTVPIFPIGTPFQQKIWAALRTIPCGKTLTYQQVAEDLQTSPRVIGNACRRNPLPIFIPCHRVVAKQHLGGYAGKTEGNMMQIKKWLITHETCKIKKE